jgi:hypothetical protein
MMMNNKTEQYTDDDIYEIAMKGLSEPEPPPEPTGGPSIWDLVIADMEERDLFGQEKYGTPLQAFNGRKPLNDAYQEALDQVVYLRQEIEERKRKFDSFGFSRMEDALTYGMGIERIPPVDFFEIDPTDTTPFMKNFTEAIRTMQHAVHQNAQDHGWWQEGREDGTVISLMHSELSECVEALRAGDPADKHCPQHGNALVELADCVIRIMDFCGRKGWNLGKAILDKHEVNKGRPVKHGGKLF